MAVYFNGRKWTSPATMSAIDESAMVNRNLTVGNVLAILGKSAGGTPKTPMVFGSYKDAAAAVQGGEALMALKKAFDPSSQTGIPSTIVFVRVDPAVQSTLVLSDAASGPVINLVSTDYGKATAGIKVKIEAASVIGKKLTTQFGQAYYSQDNVGRNCLSVLYTGAQSSASVSANASTVTLKAGGATMATIDLTAYTTVAALADRINATAGFAATVLDGHGSAPTVAALDFATDLDAKLAGGANITAHLQAVIDWFNAGEAFVSATRVDGAGTLPANIPYTYLSGGSDGAATTADWQAAFDALQTADVQWVSPVSTLPVVWAMADAHVNYMSAVMRKERRAICGMELGSTDVAAIAAAKAINSDRTSLTHIGFYDYDEAGVLTLFPASILAAQIAAAFAGSAPGKALTNKSLKIRGLERELRNPTDTDPLIEGGVLCVESTNKGYKVVKSISTWINNSNYNRVEVSTGVATDFVARNVREAVDDLRGQNGGPILLADAISRAESALKLLAMPEPMGPAVIVGDKANPAFRNITASLVGDVTRLEFECSPVIPCNYVAVVVHAVPYSGSASA